MYFCALQAGNLAAIQSQPTVVPVFDTVADLFGQRVINSPIYGSKIGYNFTLVVPTITNNDGVVTAIRDVDQGKADAFVWDALGVLVALKTADESGGDICVYAMKKRIFPFEIGFGIGKDISPQVLEALQNSLTKLDASGGLRALRNQFLDGFNKYIGDPVCPKAKKGLTVGQTAGVYIVPAAILGAIILGMLATLGCRKYKARKAMRGLDRSQNNENSSGQFASSGNIPPSPKTSSEFYPNIVHSHV